MRLVRNARRRRHDSRARDRPPRRDGLLEQLSLRRCRAQCGRPAPPGDARARLAGHARADEHRVPAGSALAVDREAFAAEVTRAIEQHPNITVVRERIDALPDHPTIIATGPLTGSALAEAIAAETGEGRPRLLRRDRPDRPPRQHRHGRLPGWRRAGTRAARTTSTARWTRPQYEDFVAALNAGEKTEFKDWEKDTPYFEGCMPIEVMAERGARNAAPRPDEAGRPRQSAHRPLALCRRPAAPGQCARHLVEHGRLPDQAEARRAGAHLPHHPRPRKCRVRPARRDPPQQLHQFAAAARRRAALEVEAQHPLRRADHRLRRLCRKRRDRPARRALRRRRAARRDASRRRRSKPRSARCSATSPAAPTPRPTSR